MLKLAKSPKVFFICGSLNHTTQMHQIAAQLPGCLASFSPYYGDALLTRLRSLGLVEPTIGGNKLRARCLDYLNAHDLDVDMDGRRGGYDLLVTCSDVIVPSNGLRGLLGRSAAGGSGALSPIGAGHLDGRSDSGSGRSFTQHGGRGRAGACLMPS